MKKALRIIVPLLMICLFGFLYLFFGSLEKIVDREEARLNLRDQTVTSVIENACRENGQILTCFETTKEDCVSKQKSALKTCLLNSKERVEGKAGMEMFLYSTQIAACAIDNFIVNHKETLRTEIKECQTPDPNSLVEVEKLLEEFQGEI